ncbi:NAC domain-containing protein 72 [Prunus yedoensis var. nudiflora]|uniref:NAC domain-containing protein 72 n=1 Tax=Prunus yedoensis var. nudiflora TaxID=2094558 RepID=A0A315ACE2_PRUYE|nr:NAC domain-containing protein 72 [Prunus yedoensis var. nudiflora]
MGVPETDPLSQLSLPPGFRFYPTDEELLSVSVSQGCWAKQYLVKKNGTFSVRGTGNTQMGHDPTGLPGLGTGRPPALIRSSPLKVEKLGLKKLWFSMSAKPQGTKTNWIMHEYRLIEPSRKNGSTKLDEWVLCRIYKKSSSSAAQKPMTTSVSSKEHSNGSSSSCSSQLDDVLEWLPEIDDRCFTLPRINSLKTLQQQEDSKLGFQMGSGNFDWASLAGLNVVPELCPNNQPQQGQGQMNVNYSNNDMYVPSIPRSATWNRRRRGSRRRWTRRCRAGSELSGLITRVLSNSNVMTQNFCNPSDPYGYGTRFGRSGWGLAVGKSESRKGSAFR